MQNHSISQEKAKLFLIEISLFDKLKTLSAFKDLHLPYAVISVSDTEVTLGVPKEARADITNNFLVRSALEDALKDITGTALVVRTAVAEQEWREARARIDLHTKKQEKKERTEAEVTRQIEAGKCNLIPFPDLESKIRTDLNIERHSIFASNTFQGDLRIIEREYDTRSGDKVTSRVRVGDADGVVKGVLKQKHQEAFYKLLEEWAKQGYPVIKDGDECHASIHLSAYELVKIITGDDCGRHYREVLILMKEMASIRVNIKNHYEKADYAETEDFSLLSYRWKSKQFNEKTLLPHPSGDSVVKILLSPSVTTNFLKKRIKPLMLKPYLKLKDSKAGLGQLLYSMLDYELSRKPTHHITLVLLSKRLGLTEYKHKSQRKRRIEPSVTALKGIELLDSKYSLKTGLVESKDKTDWVLVSERVSR